MGRIVVVTLAAGVILAATIGLSVRGLWPPRGDEADTASPGESIRPVRESEHPPEPLVDAVSVVALSANGRLVATGGFGSPSGGEIRLFDFESGRLLRRIAGCVSSHVAPLRSLAFSPDGRQLLSCSYGPLVVLSDVSTGRVVLEIEDLPGGTSEALFSPDGRTVVVAGLNEAYVRTFDAESGRLLRSFLPRAGEGAEKKTLDLALSQDGRRAISVARDGTTCVWDVEGGKTLKVLDLPETTSAASFLRDGQRILVWGRDSVALIDWRTGRTLRTRPVSDSEQLAESSSDGEIMLIIDLEADTVRAEDLATGARFGQPVAVTRFVYGTHFIPGSRRALVGDRWGGLVLVDLEHGQVLKEYAPPHGDTSGN